MKKYTMIMISAALLLLSFRLNGPQDIVCTVNTQYAGQRSITCLRENDTTLLLRDLTKGHGIITLHGDLTGNGDYRSRSAAWHLSGTETYALDAHFAVSETYRFYQTVLNRNSLDDKGMAIYTYVNDPANPNNAVWDGTALRLGINLKNGKTICSLDVTGHELTHAVLAYTCRLAPQGESGAISESICDIMGKSIERWSPNGTSDWALGAAEGLELRDLSDPHRFKQPASYQEAAYWYSGRNEEIGRHINCGVGNRMFYLLLNGINSNGMTERPIALLDADKIIYASFTKHLKRYATYADWRQACLLAASELFGPASDQYRTVAAAWSAVGVADSH